MINSSNNKQYHILFLKLLNIVLSNAVLNKLLKKNKTYYFINTIERIYK